MPTRISFGERLRQARSHCGISQRDLGVAIGIDGDGAAPRISQYERGKHIPDLQVSAQLAEVLEVPVAFFYADEEELAALILMCSKLNTEQQRALIQYFADTYGIAYEH
jgi:transcriptional regulator with XRE-family HTH domain